MIKEHEELINHINDCLNNNYSYSIEYVDNNEYTAIELHFIRCIYDEKFNSLLGKILNKNKSIIENIFPISEINYFIIYLKPIERIRKQKIIKLQSSIK